MFKVGDMAVYPAQGVGVIESIDKQEIMGQDHEVYVLRIVDTDMRIMVPINNVAAVGLRSPGDKSVYNTVLDVLKERPEEGKVASWSRRQRVYNDKIKTGDLLEVAEVLRELYIIAGGKELSYGEKKVLELTRRLLIKELAVAGGTDEANINERLETIFH